MTVYPLFDPGPEAETGALQFPGHWPGVYIQGQKALNLARLLKHSNGQWRVTDGRPSIPMSYLRQLEELVDLLESCDATKEMPAAQAAQLIPQEPPDKAA